LRARRRENVRFSDSPHRPRRRRQHDRGDPGAAGCQYENVVNLVIFLGEQFRGPVGALACLVGFILPPILATLGLLLLLAPLPQSSILDAAMTGVAFSALGMMIQIGWVGLRRIIRAPGRLAITGGVALAIIVLQLPVVGVVLVAAPIAILVAWVTRHG